MSEKGLAKKEAINTVRTLMDNSVEEFQRALPRHLEIDRFMRIALTCIRTNPRLMECTSQSLMAALMSSAQLGLEPDGILGHAYLISYKNNKKGIYEAQFQVGYRGLIALARRSGQVESFQAQVVYEHDKFDFAYGLNERLDHVPVNKDRGPMKWAYAIVKFKDGGHAFDVMTKEDIEKIKRGSKASNDGPWKTHESEMWRKTVAKRLAKYLPLSVEFQKAATLDEYVDMGLHDMPTAIEQKTDDKTAALAEKLTGGNEGAAKKEPETPKAADNKGVKPDQEPVSSEKEEGDYNV